MIQTLVQRCKIVWTIYHPVRGLFGLYLLAAVVGALLEGLMLASIVPLIGGDTGRVGRFFESALDLVGLEPSDQNLIFLIGFFVVLRSVTKYVTTLLAGLMVRRETVRLQIDLFEAYMAVEWEVAIGLSRGELQLMLAGQTRRAADLLGQFMLLVESVVFVAGLALASLVVSPSDTLLAIVLIGVTATGVSVLSGRIQRSAEGALREAKRQSNALMQFARGASVLRAFGVVHEASRQIEEQAERREGMTFRALRGQALAVALPDLFFVLALLVVLSVSFRSGQGFAQVGAVVALLYRISQYLKRFSSLGAVRERIPDLKEVYRNQQLLTSRSSAAMEAWLDPELDAGALDLDAVRYRYEKAPTAAVDGITAAVRPGEFIGIVGSSGGGKSTLVHMIARLIHPQSGEIRIGARGVGDTDALLAFVPQVPFVIEGTIAENIRWLRPIDDVVVADAAQRAGLEPVLARLPDGIHSHVAQEGLTLSGGERQRLALARSLAGSPQILVLDEATSVLDSESEKAITSTLSALRGSVTIVSVAHRLSTVLDADRVWVIERGAVVEDGSPAELLAEPASRFAKLSAMQGITDA